MDINYNNLAKHNPKAFSNIDPKLIEITPRIIPGNILDLGCNQGANLLPFLEEETNYLEGIDTSKESLKLLIKNLKKIYPNPQFLTKTIQTKRLQTYNEKIENFKFQKQYNLILAIKTLHYLAPKSIETIIKKMQQSTNIGGINFILAWENIENKKPNLTYLSQKYLVEKYLNKNWNIIDASRKDEENNENSVYLIAQRIN
ncbi:MAG: methyltransferase domain-containing protein [Nanoarchaeota archaeon]|nr:methyltransferase domain-containing protein [Nanoarchaeota archaeon]